MAKAEPERLVTLTMLADDFQKARRQEACLLKYLRREGYVIEWAIAHELTKQGARHAHAVCKGDFIPQTVLSRAAARAGMGYVVDIKAIRGLREATGYALKEALRVVGYTTKGTLHLDAHLNLNGGRVCRTTRAYFK